MNFDYLQAFVATAEAGSISAAARRLHKSQGTLSVALSNLELDLGMNLFDRSGHKPVLTDQGQQLLGHARNTLAMAESFSQKARGLHQGTEDSLTLAVDDCLSPTRLNALLKEFLTQFPQINLELLQPSSPDIPTLVKEQRAQLGITVNQTILPTDYHARTLGHMQMVVIAGAEHPLARQKQITLEEISLHLQIWPASRHSHEAFFYPAISSQRWAVERLSEVVALVEAGIGWSAVPAYLTTEGLRRKTLVAIHHEMSAAGQIVPVDMIWHKGLNPGPATSWLIENTERFVSDL